VIFHPVGPFVGFESFEANPDFSTNGASFTVTARDQFGNTYTSAPLNFMSGPGQDRFSIESDATQYITQVTLTSSAVINDVEQVRVGALVRGAAVPEPSTVLSTLVIVGMGAVVGWRRRQQGA